MGLITKYFPELSEEQIQLFTKLEELYPAWNEKINVISRKDISELSIRHIIHSLGIAKYIKFTPGTQKL